MLLAPSAPESIGILANVRREAAVTCARDLVELLEARRVRVSMPHDLADALVRSNRGVEDAGLSTSDLLIALGGDGTLLAANRIASASGAPILGVHVGGPASFGFLTETTPNRARAAVESVLAGRYEVEARVMVSGVVTRRGQTVVQLQALNDIVIRAQARMLRLRVSVGDTFIATYAADGIIVATPTGSTAYNLAAGGPVVHPGVETILLTPICPHTLNVRSLLVGVDHAIHVRLETGDRDVTLMTVDGQVSFQLDMDDEVLFTRSEQQARFITIEGPDFYQKVQTRLRLGERFGS